MLVVFAFLGVCARLVLALAHRPALARVGALAWARWRGRVGVDGGPVRRTGRQDGAGQHCPAPHGVAVASPPLRGVGGEE